MDEIIQFDQQLLLALNGSDSIFLDSFWMAITKTGTWILFYCSILYVLFRSTNNRQVLLILLMMGLAILLADQVASGICKPFFHRFRPTHEPLLEGQVDIVNGYRSGLYGFMSSHAANGFAICTFMSLILRNRWTTTVLIFYACITSFSRIYLGVHYPGDILCGGIWGVMSGLIVYKLYSYCLYKFNNVLRLNHNTSTPLVMVIKYTSLPVCVFIITVVGVSIYALIHAI